MNSAVTHPSVALVAYAEPFVAGRNVVVFGDASSPLAEYLVERGARFVQVYDTDAERAKQASHDNGSRNIDFAGLTAPDTKARIRSFDFGIVENLTRHADPSAIVERLATLVSSPGAALVGVPNPAAALKPTLGNATESGSAELGYYELYDQAAEQFSEVRMLGQLPFVGYAIADFSSEGEADVSVDTAFVPSGSEEPSWFWALCSHDPLLGEAFSIVQLPLSQTTQPEPQPVVATVPQQTAPQQAAPQQDDTRIAELRQTVAKREAWITELEARATAADARADRAEADLERAQQQTSQRDQSNRKTHDELEAVRARLREAEGKLAALETAAPEESDADAVALEAQLKERGALIEQLEARLREAERVVADLVRELETARRVPAQAPSSQDDARVEDLQHKLDNLALANAERAALLASAEASIAELQTKLAATRAASNEDGERELELARAELQRQQALLHQQQAGLDSAS